MAPKHVGLANITLKTTVYYLPMDVFALSVKLSSNSWRWFWIRLIRKIGGGGIQNMVMAH
jgi:hypothetical protein